MISISKSAQVSRLADIEDSKFGTSILIEDRVYIDSFVRIRPVGGRGDVRIGKDSFINAGTVIFSGNGVDIGQWVLIAPNCTLAPTNHAYASRERTIRHQGFLPSKGGIVIEDDCWIGANCTVLDGSLLRKGCVIGAGSLVRGEVEAYSVNSGNPLRKTGMRGD
ncbi:MAG: acyltransferase [Minwuia sp.]|uniref:acyltransferase n=1 Tax=Minwuia sp. TaxID=2493630 RepID=UPI003A8A339C